MCNVTHIENLDSYKIPIRAYLYIYENLKDLPATQILKDKIGHPIWKVATLSNYIQQIQMTL